ncbi:hypothetical protein CAPTEDRAFT_185334 [Capitella teleta]|uniref:HAT C-terminal dimerisation domain-containing protein n=1 Tax=Capitella teleta TaxID=283909 RepID=R7U9Q0_CAPTE|nr:hypothetical protein CAPTEDRAFT_185334 [Capitella teleta]|eukprot:ELU00533.1 hypothetical protein CAPTEDRAFT_185334 [Capitella teleta]
MAQRASNLEINTVKSVLMATAMSPAGVQGGIILSLHDLPNLSQGYLRGKTRYKVELEDLYLNKDSEDVSLQKLQMIRLRLRRIIDFRSFGFGDSAFFMIRPALAVIFQKYKENHENILGLIDLWLTLPASSAEAERVFSQLKIVKSDIRSKLQDTRVSDLLTIQLCSPSIEDFDPTEAIHLWNNHKNGEVIAPMLNLHDRLEDAYRIVWENLQVAAEQNNAFAKTHGKPFRKSDLCWVAEKRQKKGECPKLKPKWRGPFLVRILNDVLVEVQISARKSCVYHTDLLKHCFSNDLPVWLTRMQRSLQAKEGKGKEIDV